MGCKAVVVCQCRVEWLSRWLLMAHWRCTKAFDLSASLPCALAACPPSLFSSRFLAPLSPFLSSLSLSPSIWLLPDPLPVYYSARCSSFVRRCSSLFPRATNTHVHTRASVPLHRSFPLSRLLPSRFRGPCAPLPRPYSSPRLLPHPPLGTPGPSPHRLERIARYDLHSSRNKTSTTLLNDKRNRALSVL